MGYVASANTKEISVPVVQLPLLSVLYSQVAALASIVTVTVPSLLGLLGNVTPGAAGDVVSITI